MKEIWAKVKSAPNYKINDKGDIVNINTNKALKPKLINGFLYVVLYADQRRVGWYVHRLVACTFLPDYEEGREVKHIDEDHTNNALTNLTMNNKGVRVRKTDWWL